MRVRVLYECRFNNVEKIAIRKKYREKLKEIAPDYKLMFLDVQEDQEVVEDINAMLGNGFCIRKKLAADGLNVFVNSQNRLHIDNLDIDPENVGALSQLATEVYRELYNYGVIPIEEYERAFKEKYGDTKPEDIELDEDEDIPF